MRRMQNGSKPSIQMVCEACLRSEARPSVELAKRLSLPERIPTTPAQRPAEPEKPAELERIPTSLAQRPAEPERPPMEMVDPSVSVNTVEVTLPLITRCDKSTQNIFPYVYVKRLDFGKRCMEQPQSNKRLSIKQEPSKVSKNIVLWKPRNHPFMKLSNNGFIIQPTNVNGINK
ncbi:hypothetical protein TNCV_1347791 [Trichonephila clavipes]|nr:hypothetical protein TNCV_1347791 [Trichonephila clavipes]